MGKRRIHHVRTHLGAFTAFLLLAGCAAFPGEEAPEECGFPDGTALSFAGRSTTAALDVQEVVGDPMSHEPADIYITLDALEHGELSGRLVCAIFVDQPGFVEVTVHPADGGRVPDEAEPPVAPPLQPPDGISMGEAVDAARDAVPDADEWEVVAANAGPLGVIEPMWQSHELAGDLSADLWVWRVFLVRGDQGVDVLIDFVDGSVYGVLNSIVN